MSRNPAVDEKDRKIVELEQTVLRLLKEIERLKSKLLTVWGDA